MTGQWAEGRQAWRCLLSGGGPPRSSAEASAGPASPAACASSPLRGGAVERNPGPKSLRFCSRSVTLCWGLCAQVLFAPVTGLLRWPVLLPASQVLEVNSNPPGPI